MPDDAGDSTRYEDILRAGSVGPGDLAGRFAAASRAARAAVAVESEREVAIRDVAAGVAAPALVAFAAWLLEEAQRRGLRRLRFLSRDGQVLCELTRRLAAAEGTELDLEYVYSSRITWSLAATDASRLAEAPWLLNSFVKSSATDVCARLGLPFSQFRHVLLGCGASLDPDVRADQPAQAEALRRFAATPQVKVAAGARIEAMRDLVLDYAPQHQLADADTGLVDIGWTGRMAGSFIELCEEAGMSRPAVLLWGHEPRATGWTDPDRVAAYMYNNATGEGRQWRVPNVPFIMETFCMADHGIVSGYLRGANGIIRPELLSAHNHAAQFWGLELYRRVLYAFAAALEPGQGMPSADLRPVLHRTLSAFWCHPTHAEALAWGSYPYDSDPVGTAIRLLARPFTVDDHVRGDRAWIAGSLILSSPDACELYLSSAPENELAGAPEADLSSRLAVHLGGCSRC